MSKEILMVVDAVCNEKDVEKPIIFEAIERRANILLVQESLILDCIRRVGAQDNRVRVSLPGRDYVPPPPQQGKTLMQAQETLEKTVKEWEAKYGEVKI